MLSRRWLFPFLALAILVLLAACGGSTPVPTPTRQPKPTFTPTPEGQLPNADLFKTPENAGATTAATEVAALPTRTATPTELPPTATPEPVTPTPTTQPAAAFANQAVNVRGGPGVAYGRIGNMAVGQRYPITGRNEGGDWWQIDYNGQQGWVVGNLVSTEGTVDGVQVAQAAAPPPPRPTSPPPPPTSTPVPAGPPPTAVPQYGWTYVTGSAIPAPQCGVVHLSGKVQYANGSPQNGVCVLIDYYGPRQIKFSGSGGQGDGNWGFAPCAEGDCKGPYKVYVVECPANVPDAGLSITSNAPPPQSDIFTGTVTDKCTTGQWENIIFKNTRQ